MSSSAAVPFAGGVRLSLKGFGQTEQAAKDAQDAAKKAALAVADATKVAVAATGDEAQRVAEATGATAESLGTVQDQRHSFLAAVALDLGSSRTEEGWA